MQSRIDDYAKDGGLGEELYYLVGYEAEIHKLSSNSFSKPVHLISKPYGLKYIANLLTFVLIQVCKGSW